MHFSKTKQETTSNRFVLLGIVGKDKVVAVFACTQLERVELLRFCNNITPGIAVAMIRPNFDYKFMGSVSTTPILNTAEPLVRLKLKTCRPISVSAPDFFHFNKVTKTLVLSNVDNVSPVCKGLFCDGHPETDCQCWEVDNRKASWDLALTFISRKFLTERNFDRKTFNTHFALKCKTADNGKSNFDVLTLSDCENNCVTRVNFSLR